MNITTPLVNGGIDGTEAVIRVDKDLQTEFLYVYEGQMTVTPHDAGQSALTVAGGNGAYVSSAGQLALARAEVLPDRYRRFMVTPMKAIHWAIYYPPVLLAEGTGDPALEGAAVLLAGGQPAQAETALRGLERSGTSASARDALLAIIAVAQGRLDEARKLAEAAIALDKTLPAGWISQSYVHQASGELEAARDAAAKATELDGAGAYAWARLAEVELTIGNHRAGQAAAQKSVALGETSLGYAMLGFAGLSVADYDRSQVNFDRAIQLDSQSPLPRLGSGLAQIRKGKLDTGRQTLETAVSLDPRNAGLRTWLGRAYYEEGLTGKAATEFAFAIERDPADPTPHFFSALERYAANRPIDALRALEASDARGGARAVTRGRQGLSEDRAVRGAAVGRVYDLLGFGQLAGVEGTRAVDADPASPVAHRFLSDIYRARPGFQIAQTSELLKSQLLSPPTKDAVQAQLAETDLALLAATGPARVTFNEFTSLFQGDGIRVDLSGVGGTQGTLGNQVSASILSGRFSLGVGQYHFESDGYRSNNDVRHDMVSAEAHASVTPWLDLFAEARYRDSEQGDRLLRFDETAVDNTLRRTFERSLFRIGAHIMHSPGQDFLFAGTFVDATSQTTTSQMPPGPFLFNLADRIESSGFDLQGQYLGHLGPVALAMGASGTWTEQDNFMRSDLTPLPIGTPCFIPGGCTTIDLTSPTAQHGSAYAYATIQWPAMVQWTLGVSIDHLDEAPLERTRVNPKAGVRAELLKNFSLRAAYSRTLKRPLLTDQTLEPTSIAGFNQFFDDFDGADADLYGIGLDWHPMPNFWAGAEAVWRDVSTPVIGPGTNIAYEDSEEQNYRLYANLTLGSRWAVSASLEHTRLDSDVPTTPDKLEATLAPVTIRYFDRSGAFASLGITPFHQSIQDSALALDDDEEGILVDAAIGYRLPRQRGVISLEAQNLFDQDFNFQDRLNVSPRPATSPLIARELTVLGRATFKF